MENTSSNRSNLTVTSLFRKEYIKEFYEIGEQKFRDIYCFGFLIVVEEPPYDGAPISPQTLKSSYGAARSVKKKNQEHRLISLTKSDRNPFLGKITIGRARNNDVVIRSPKISKLHCVLFADESGLAITDMGSSNGTFIQGVRLESKETRKLSNGEWFSLWRYMFEFQDVDHFIESIK